MLVSEIQIPKDKKKIKNCWGYLKKIVELFK